jgi:hypothetical protein
MLDLDDAGAEIRQDHGAVRAGEDACEVEDGDSVERARHGIILVAMAIVVYSGAD